MSGTTLVLDVPCTAAELAAGFGGTARQEVLFRGRPVRWTQDERVDPSGTAGEFEQSDGPFADLRGRWTIEPDGLHCTLRYELEVRTSVAHLAGAIDPMIRRVLLRHVVQTVDGVAGPVRVREGDDELRDRVVSPP